MSTDAKPNATVEAAGVVIVEPVFVVSLPTSRLFSPAFKGSRAQLEDEGLIPPGLKWPDAQERATWVIGQFCYSLKRTRPAGLKGGMKLWIRGDYWIVEWNLENKPSLKTILVGEKAEALRAEIYLRSPDGEREWRKTYHLCCKAREDKAFQAFKSAFVPERKKPGRPKQSKVATENHCNNLGSSR